MSDHPILDEVQHQQALDRLERLWGADPGTPEAEELDRIAARIHAYEAAYLDEILPAPAPGALIDAKRRELDLSQNELARRLGWTSGRLSEVVNGKRDLTLRMVRDLVEVLQLDVYSLIRADLPPGALWLREGTRALLDRLVLRDAAPPEVVVTRALVAYAETPCYRPPVSTFTTRQDPGKTNVLSFSRQARAA